MNDPKLNAAGRRLGLSSDFKDTWEEHAKKKTRQTGSAEQGNRYGKHIAKAAMHRKMRNKENQLKGPLGG